jgi:hypothetical protein
MWVYPVVNRISMPRLSVDSPREQFLAHPGLAEQQHRQVRVRHDIDLVEQREQRLAVADDLVVESRFARPRCAGTRNAKRAHLLLQPAHPDRRLGEDGGVSQTLAGALIERTGA